MTEIQPNFAAIERFVNVGVPERVCVLGIGDEDIAGFRSPLRISSVQLPAYALGREAARLVLEMFSGESPPPDPVLLPPLRVVPRESTGALSIGDDEMHAARTPTRPRGGLTAAIPACLPLFTGGCASEERTACTGAT